ncbi:YtxH domain-containing protein [Pedobacter caeni]|uniref:Gas vesicle protein n=1 Tax=Pedobacter caeni TaxID=288992 RepID=A0A1M5JEV9_9SPHI|nr:YtxH domain-containing protein [Pedobacter caeni]SHG38800.1 Gas vesicle protein [Pedobacter caeni]
MKYNNFRKAVSSLTSQRSDSSLPVVALLTGLAVGAVIGVLFAPERGADIRTKISDKAKDLSDAAKDKLQAVKNKFHSEGHELADLKDEVVDKVKSKARAAEELKDEVIEDAKSKAKDLADDVKAAANEVKNS